MPRQFISALSIEEVGDERLTALASKAFEEFQEDEGNRRQETVGEFEAACSTLTEPRAHAFALITLRELRLHAPATDEPAKDFHTRMSREITARLGSPQSEPFGIALNAALDGYLAFLVGDDNPQDQRFETIFQQCMEASREADQPPDRKHHPLIIQLLRLLTVLRRQIVQNPALAEPTAAEARAIVNQVKREELNHVLICEEAKLLYALRRFPKAEGKFRSLIKDDWNVNEASLYLGRIYLHQGRYHRAHRMFRNCEQGFTTNNNRRGQLACMQEIARLKLAFFAYEEAERLFEASIRLADDSAAEFEVARGKLGLGVARYYMDDFKWAEKLLEESRADFVRLCNSRYELRAACWYGSALAAREEFRKADSVFDEANARITALLREADAKPDDLTFLFDNANLLLHWAATDVQGGDLTAARLRLADVVDSLHRRLNPSCPSSADEPSRPRGDEPTIALWLGRMRLNESFVLLQMGERDEVERKLNAVSQEVEAALDHRLTMEHLAVRAFALSFRGEDRKARLLISKALKEAGESAEYSELEPPEILLRQCQQYQRLAAPGRVAELYRAFCGRVEAQCTEVARGFRQAESQLKSEMEKPRQPRYATSDPSLGPWLHEEFAPLNVRAFGRTSGPARVPRPRRHFLHQLIGLSDYGGQRDVFIDPGELTRAGSSYNTIFRRQTGTNLQTVLRGRLDREVDGKAVLWLVEHLAEPRPDTTLFAVERTLGVVGRYGAILLPFIEHWLRGGASMVYVCGGAVLDGDRNKLLSLLKGDAAHRLYIRYIDAPDQRVKAIMPYDFYLCGDDVFLGELPSGAGQGQYSVRKSVILRDRLITEYKQMPGELRDHEVVMSPDRPKTSDSAA